MLFDFPNICYSPVIIDSNLSEFAFAARLASQPHTTAARLHHTATLRRLWTSEANPNHVLPCLCVRTGLDLYLRVKAFPPGSEVIMSALNLEDMAHIVRHHGLRVVSVDVDLETLEPKLPLMESLISPGRTVAILVAHLFGRWVDMEPFVALAQKYNLCVIEDCAESFCGFSRTGHPGSDIALFSFGIVKFYTSFGGGIAKVKSDEDFRAMSELYEKKYPTQSSAVYLKKILKYAGMHTLLQVWPWPEVFQMSRRLGVDWKDRFISWMRGFPADLIANIRCQPSTPLLAMMAHKQLSFSQSEFDIQRVKAEYFLSKLDDCPGATSVFREVGTKVKVNNYWLLPVLVDRPDVAVKLLGVVGVDVYRDSNRQITVIVSDECEETELGGQGGGGRGGRGGGSSLSAEDRFPHNAKYFNDHVIYMPVNKWIPFKLLDQMANVCGLVSRALQTSGKDTSVHKWKTALLKSKL